MAKFIYSGKLLDDMRRKIIKQGAATLTLSLPAKWTKQLNLRPGDEVDVIEEDKTLIVSSTKLPSKKQITVEMTDSNREDITLILMHLYRVGFDTITIRGIDQNLMNEINATTKDLLLGFEVTERDKKQCVISNISEPTEEKYEVLLRRVFLIIKETQDVILGDFSKGKFESKQEVEAMRKQQDKFILFCRRILMREKAEKSILDWELLTFLMHIQHAYYYLYMYAYQNKVGKNPKFIELLKDLEDYFQLLYDAYYKKDVSFIHKINKQKKDYQYGLCYKYLEQAKGKDAPVFAHIREIFRLVQIGSSPILAGLFEKENI